MDARIAGGRVQSWSVPNFSDAPATSVAIIPSKRRRRRNIISTHLPARRRIAGDRVVCAR